MKNLKKPNPNRDISCQGFTFLSQFIDHHNYFEARYNQTGKKWYPKRTIQQIINYHKFCNISRSAYFKHLTGDPNSALGFTNKATNGQHYHLYCLDVDLIKANSYLINAAKALMEKELGCKIFWEPSTSGTSLHGFIIVCKHDKSVIYTNKIMRGFEKVVNQKGKKIGLKAVEVMGLPYEYRYENNRIVEIKGSTPAKLPQSMDLTALIHSEIIPLKQLERYVWAHEDVAFEEPKEGSTGYKYYGFSGIMQKIQGDVINHWGVSEQQLGRRKIYSGHMAVYLYLLYFCRKSKITHPSHALIKWHWNRLYDLNLIGFKYNSEIVTWCRNYFSSCGMIDWLNNEYCMSVITDDGEIAVQGIACSFQMDQRLFNLLGGNKFHTGISIFDLKCSNEHKVPVHSRELRRKTFFCGVT